MSQNSKNELARVKEYNKGREKAVKAMNAAKSSTNQVIKKHTEAGDVGIAAEVVMSIVAVAVTEVRGVHHLKGTSENQIVTMLSNTVLSRGIHVTYHDEESCSIAVEIVLDYGYAIPKVSAQVQDKVKSSVENMTGIQVKEVTVKVTGVNIDNI